MSPELIKAISELWLLALVVVLGLGGITFRHQIRNFLDRVLDLKLKRGELEVAATLANTPNKPKELPAESDPPLLEEPPPDEKDRSALSKVASESQVATSEVVSGNPQERMWNALKARDKTQLEESYREAREKEEDATIQIEIECLYYTFQYLLGDTKAIQKLKEFAANEKAAYEARGWLGFCFKRVGEYAAAIAEYEIAYGLADDLVRRVQPTIQIAGCLLKMGEQEAAYTRLMSEIGKQVDSDHLVNLYEALASFYEESGKTELRALVLEAALEHKPNDTSLQFKAAWSYSNKNFDELALLHYQAVLVFQPDDAGTINNLGVQYTSLNMPIHSVANYKKAVEGKNTLAASNLANLYMNAGFYEEAKQVLEKAKEVEGFHPNVGASFSTLAQKSEAEDEKNKELMRAARAQQQFLLIHAKSYFTGLAEPVSLNGIWLIPDGNEITLTQEGINIKAVWGAEGVEEKIEGVLVNRGVRVTFYKMGYAYPYSSKSFQEEARGYGYVSLDGNELRIMTFKDKKHSTVIIRRKEVLLLTAAQPLELESSTD